MVRARVRVRAKARARARVWVVHDLDGEPLAVTAVAAARAARHGRRRPARRGGEQQQRIRAGHRAAAALVDERGCRAPPPAPSREHRRPPASAELVADAVRRLELGIRAEQRGPTEALAQLRHLVPVSSEAGVHVQLRRRGTTSDGHRGRRGDLRRPGRGFRRPCPRVFGGAKDRRQYMLWQHSAVRLPPDAARRSALRSGEQNRIGPPFGMCRKRHGDTRANVVWSSVGQHAGTRQVPKKSTAWAPWRGARRHVGEGKHMYMRARDQTTHLVTAKCVKARSNCHAHGVVVTTRRAGVRAASLLEYPGDEFDGRLPPRGRAPG